MNLLDDRYSRQRLVAGFGDQGQEKLQARRVALVGCGALGCSQAQLLGRAGVGKLTLIDRDFVEITNLHRQVLFDEQDAREALPKAEAAARRLRRINSSIEIVARVADVTAHTIEGLLEGADLVLDATDNIEARYLINDVCVKNGVPWIYGGALGVEGTVMAIHPGQGPCLRCLFDEPPPPGTLPTCDMLGVLNVTPTITAALQVAEALKICAGKPTFPGVTAFELWGSYFRTVKVERNPSCPCCAQRNFEFLEMGRAASGATSLCGRNAVQIRPASEQQLDLEALASRLASAGKVTNNGFLLRLEVGAQTLHVFKDARAIVKGTDDPAIARALYARYVGS
ncbi:MAG: ThiF family adenylyltransferase [Deltaproteobacteria bacterium]|nr:ThiF family adenylyltransferase [Deltaproteobacteria bacterium]